jgi:4a-hydroxytetrahydrobiopterin dehydratase
MSVFRRDALTVTSEITEFKAPVPDCEIVELDGVERPWRVFFFDDFAQPLVFTNKLGGLAGQEGDHSALRAEWGRATDELCLR